MQYLLRLCPNIHHVSIDIRHHQRHAAQQLASHHNLLQTDLYQGRDDILAKVTWVREGGADQLVVKGDPARNREVNNDCPELASLLAIVWIDHNDFWLTLDAGY